MENFDSIIVVKPKNQTIEVIQNLTSYQLIGRGGHGAVFKISDEKCVKVYADSHHKKQEEEVLIEVQSSPYFPKLYQSGSKYLVMEYIKGISLKNYPKDSNSPLSPKLVKNLMGLLYELERFNLRQDAGIQNILLTDTEEIKIIDHVNSKKTRFDKPRRFVRGLKELSLLESFLKQVKEEDQELYNRLRDVERTTPSARDFFNFLVPEAKVIRIFQNLSCKKLFHQ